MAAIKKIRHRGESNDDLHREQADRNSARPGFVRNLLKRGRLIACACSAAAALAVAVPAPGLAATTGVRPMPAMASGWYVTSGPAAADVPGCGKGANVRKVVATYKAKKYHAGGYRTDTLYCGNNKYGYRHLEQHIGQYPNGWGFFDFSMRQTLKAPGKVIVQDNGNYREIAPIYQCFYAGYYIIWNFNVISGIKSGTIVTAWGNKGKRVNTSCPRP